jgi:branched-chain amino acid transport system permease protein
VAILLLALTALAFPALFGPYTTGVATVAALTIPGAVALNLLQGVAGQVSAGNAAFLAIGTMVTATMVRQWPGVSFLVVLPTAGLVAAAIGAIVALPALRVRGLYLLIGTLALHYIVVYSVYVYQKQTVGPTGFMIPTPSIAGFVVDSPVKWYYVLLIFAVAALWQMANILRTRVGRAWIAVRDGDVAAEIVGVNVIRAKISAFVVSSFMIGVQGGLFAYYTQVITNELFTLDLAIQYIAIVIIGGMGSVYGTVLGTVAIVGLPYLLQQLALGLPPDFGPSHIVLLRIFDVQNITYGLLIMAFLLFAPGGLVSIWARLMDLLRLWPFTRQPVLR